MSPRTSDEAHTSRGPARPGPGRRTTVRTGHGSAGRARRERLGNTRAGLETVSDTAIGANHAIWDTTLGTPEVADLVKGAGVRALRYPGGSYSDIHHWRDHTAPGGHVAP
ncbi:hypothetical protein [Umezawaea sp.]|uniref:hypothetical protein n=1 Tax=Umezawaea sp. TaxID=1955258 RepID=UPI002ED6BFA8